ncbi:V-type proton ATPase subunit S1-like [Xenia sp. Carnegie-2017]|uniref:V-type proton ATPase subunit S1-like n=1 Tax=Xenia sp. Carnegie-2017 TaxID=2897299 RepID=UPI001F0436C9|nr:V-type proton ATPase subunit S1-like [Xenia sp. Carnegie-2017]
MASTGVISGILFFIYFCCCKASLTPVPLLIWSSKSVEVEDDIVAGRTFSYEDIQTKYLDKLKSQSKTICVFVQDKLSVDDFATNSAERFKHLKKILYKSPTSIVLPSVALKNDLDYGDNKLARYMRRNIPGNVELISQNELDNFPERIKSMKSDEPTLFVVHLPNSKNGPLRNLELSDQMIGKVSDILSHHYDDYIALLTADKPRDDIQSAMDDARVLSVSPSRQRRSLNDGFGDDKSCNRHGVFVANNSFMFYFKDIVLFNKTQGRNDSFRPNVNINITGNQIQDFRHDSYLITVFPLENVFANGSKIKLNMTFKNAGYRWYCVGIGVNGVMGGESFHEYYNCQDKIDAPIDKSFSCQVNVDFCKFDSNKKKTCLEFVDVQIQPFGVRNQRFANSINCVGFFTPPIWMGLITVGVLIAILYGGMLALLSIRSLDRFDNPKDPAIVINSE